MMKPMAMMSEVENMSEERQLKAELERYFTAVVDEQYQKQYPDVTSPLGTPLFYDEYGEIDADYISEMTGMSPTGVKTSFDAWKASGNIPPTEKPPESSKPARQGPLSRPNLAQVPVPERREGTSILSGIKEDMNDVLEMRQLEHQLNSVGDSYNQYPNTGHQSDLTAIITALAPLLKQDRPSIDPMTMTLMKQLNDRTQDSTAQMIALFNMNQNSNQQWMTMLMENMRQGGNRSSLEDRLLNHSLDRMLSGGDTPEDSIFSELVKSGQLGEIVQGAAAGIAGIANRRVPMGENPYQGQEVLPAPELEEVPVAAELAPTFDAPETVPSAMTYQEKCTFIMEEMRPSLSDEWKGDGNTMNMLMNVVEVAVKRGEDFYPGDEQAQLALAAKETLMVANLRTIGTSLNRIEKGEISIDLASSVLTQHPLWQVFSNETYESLLSAVNAYAGADLEDSPSLVHDLEYLNRPTTRPIIESLLATAKGGGAQ